MWQGQPIALELEHINGDNTDHRIENLQILCPNCHAQTPTYRGRNKLSSLNERRALNPVKFGEPLTGDPERSPKKERVETLRREPKTKKTCECGTQISQEAIRCRECDYAARRTARPGVFQLLKDFEELTSFVQVGKKYNVCDNAVRKWLRTYKIDLDMVKRKSSAQTEMAAKAVV
jgi:hypothetical protein